MIYNPECNTRAKRQEQSQVELQSREDCVKAPRATTLTFPVMEIQGLQPHAAGLNACAAPPSTACLFCEGFLHFCSSVHTFVKQCWEERGQFGSRLLGFFTTTWMNCSPPFDQTMGLSWCVLDVNQLIHNFKLLRHTESAFFLSVTIIRGQTSANTVTCFPLQWKQSGTNACMWCLSAGSCHWPLSAARQRSELCPPSSQPSLCDVIRKQFASWKFDPRIKPLSQSQTRCL